MIGFIVVSKLGFVWVHYFDIYKMFFQIISKILALWVRCGYSFMCIVDYHIVFNNGTLP